MPGHRISHAPVLHGDAFPATTLIPRRQPTSINRGVRGARRRLPPQTARRLHPRLSGAIPISSVIKQMPWSERAFGISVTRVTFLLVVSQFRTLYYTKL